LNYARSASETRIASDRGQGKNSARR